MADPYSPSVGVVDYDPRWPLLFAAEKTRILSALTPLQVNVEHVGSTAVPGLAAKPVIDILLGLRMAELTDVRLDALRLIGYGYVRARRGRLCLYRGRPRSHFVHVVETGGSDWQEKLLFRDYLRAHPQNARRYGDLKRALTIDGSRGAKYAIGKRAVIAELMGQARRWNRVRANGSAGFLEIDNDPNREAATLAPPVPGEALVHESRNEGGRYHG